MESDVPQAGRGEFLTTLIGSPDPLQVDGLGGGFSSTSKVMLVKKDTVNPSRIDYLFAQILIDKAKVDYSANCGNLTSAVGPFAVDKELVKAPWTSEPKTFEVKMFNLNTSKHIVSRFNVTNGKTDYSGTNRITGVPQSGVAVEYSILNPAGTATNKPILERSLKVNFEGRGIEVSVIDVSSVYAFVEPSVFGLTGIELPPDVNSNTALLGKVEKLRLAVKEALGDRLPATKEVDDAPLALRIVMVSKMRGYKDWMGKEIKVDDADVMVRAFSLGKMHHAVPFTAALCTAAASKIPGTIAHRNAKTTNSETIRIAHPKGVAVAAAGVSVTRGKATVRYVKGSRTARLLMDGLAFVQA